MLTASRDKQRLDSMQADVTRAENRKVLDWLSDTVSVDSQEAVADVSEEPVSVVSQEAVAVLSQEPVSDVSQEAVADVSQEAVSVVNQEPVSSGIPSVSDEAVEVFVNSAPFSFDASDIYAVDAVNSGIFTQPISSVVPFSVVSDLDVTGCIGVVFVENANLSYMTTSHDFSVSDLSMNQMTGPDMVQSLTVIGNGITTTDSGAVCEAEDVAVQQDITVGSVPKPSSVRKKVSRPLEWKRNKNKGRRERGKQYTSVSGKNVPSRTVHMEKHPQPCRMGCEEKISADERQEIHNDFWKLSEPEKRHYFARTTKCEYKKRTRTDRERRTNKNRSRTYSYKYYFVVHESVIQVCKSYYLSTLDISNQRITTYYSTRNQITGTPSESKQGRHVKKKISEEHRFAIRAHINSFPRVDSHYCRANSNRQYLDPFLSVARMYELFCDRRLEENAHNPLYTEPVKKHL